METTEGYDPALWAALAEMGVVGLIVDEEYGGVGAGPVELERVTEETGAALLCGPLISSGVLAAGLIQALGDEAAKSRLLPGIAAGTTIATVALTGRGAAGPRPTWRWPPRPRANGWTLAGTSSFVTHGQIADVILVAARGRRWDRHLRGRTGRAGPGDQGAADLRPHAAAGRADLRGRAGAPAGGEPAGLAGGRSGARPRPRGAGGRSRPAPPSGRWSSRSTTPRPAPSSAG